MSSSFPHRAAIETYVRKQALPIEKYGHQPRLYALTRPIGEGLDYDDDIVHAAVWLHDLGVFVGHRPEDPVLLAAWDNVAYAVAKAPNLLRGFGFPEEKVDAVLECIHTHQPSAMPSSIEATIVRDADILEQLGAVGLARTLCKVGRDTRFATFTQAQTSLRRAVEELPGKLRLPRSRELAEARIRLHWDFLNGLREEAGECLH